MNTLSKLSYVFILVSLICLLCDCGGGQSGSSATGSNTGSSTEAALDRSTAKELVFTKVVNQLPDPDRAAALLMQQPLQPGDTVIPGNDDPATGFTTINITSESWFGIVDPDPYEFFSHDVIWVLIDTQSGASQQIPSKWYPRINGDALYATTDELEGPDRIYPDKSSNIARDYVSDDYYTEKIKLTFSSPGFNILPDPGDNRDTEPRMIAIVISGQALYKTTDGKEGVDTSKVAPNNKWAEFLKNNGFNANDVHQGVGSYNDPDYSKYAADMINTFCRTLNACDKLQLIIISHGYESGIMMGNGAFYYDSGPSYLSSDFNAVSLPDILAKLPNTYINIILVACHSGGAISRMKKTLKDAGKIGLIQTACSEDKTTTSGGSQTGYNEVYTEQVLNSLNGKNLDTNGDGKTSIQELETGLEEGHNAAASKLGTQSPQIVKIQD